MSASRTLKNLPGMFFAFTYTAGTMGIALFVGKFLDQLASKFQVPLMLQDLLSIILFASGICIVLGLLLGIALEETEFVFNSGLPSFIYGIFGLALISVYFKASSPLAKGAMTLSVFVLPVMVNSTRKAISSVPSAMHKSATALGASRLQRMGLVTLPFTLNLLMKGALQAVASATAFSVPVLLAAYFTDRHVIGYGSMHNLKIQIADGPWYFRPAALLMLTSVLLNLVSTRVGKKAANRRNTFFS